jgi:hypothetical protein
MEGLKGFINVCLPPDLANWTVKLGEMEFIFIRVTFLGFLFSPQFYFFPGFISRYRRTSISGTTFSGTNFHAI